MINAETVCKAVEISWRLAHEEHYAGSRRLLWSWMQDELRGMWRLVNCGMYDDNLLSDIALLTAIADMHYRDALYDYLELDQ